MKLLKYLVELTNIIVTNPALLYLLGTIVAIVCIGIFAGIKIACLVLGVWAFIFMVGYFVAKHTWEF